MARQGTKIVRVAIYNEYWSTLGGGEQSALHIAAALQQEHDVYLLSPQPVHILELEEHCGQSLRDVKVLTVGSDRHSVECASVDFDVFINHSHQSTVRNFARYGVYQVMFPQKIQRHLLRTSNQKDAHAIDTIFGLDLELKGIDCFVSDGEAWFSINPERKLSSLSLLISTISDSRVTVTIIDSSNNSKSSEESFHVAAKMTSCEIDRLPPNCAVIIKSESPTDTKRVPFKLHCLIDQDDVSYSPTEIAKALPSKPESPAEFLQSYQSFVANSVYTKEWTSTYLGVPSTVIYPPVLSIESVSQRVPHVVSIGRFFEGQNVHSKNQLQMAQTFKKLPIELLNKWRLVLIGGTSRDHREYALRVRSETRGYPIDLYFNASRDVLLEQLKVGSIYWHLAGFGRDLDEHPEGAEHFGIAIVEAMGAGLIPLAFNAGGPKEILRNFPELLFNSLDELLEKTVRYMKLNDESMELRQRLIAETKRFSINNYHASWRNLIDGLN